ncbi:Hypothetical predicted protein [Cloeon dipterum]|uniref:RING-type domain-containing protein n=2 Tax=Cloeon dipterum TaxID=197152 RepID=A0A8S1CQT1_9INSE|nr:Hypothetical predicted protein [Cloeon dipterum]
MRMQQHQQCSRLKLQDLNSHLVCDLCKGYLIDATTIVECLHTFCRSCLVRHIDRQAACPTCDAPLPKAKPFLHIRSDKTLQDIVYKLVPGLYHAEMQRRRDFYAKHPDEVWRTSPEERGTTKERLIFSPQDQFSLSLEYLKSPSECRNDDWETGSTRSTTSSHESGSEGATGRRYLQCPALFTVNLLKKFLRSKFGLKPDHKVDVIHRKVCLPDDYTIMDVAYIYSWRQASPMRFSYCFYHEPALQHAPPRRQQQQQQQQQLVTVAEEIEPPAPKESEEGSSAEAPSAVAKPEAADSKVEPEKKVDQTEEVVVAPKSKEHVGMVVTQNEDEHPVISIPSPLPSSESTPEMDLLDIIDKNIKEETALANNNNNEPVHTPEEVQQRPKSPPREAPARDETPPPPPPPPPQRCLSVSVAKPTACTPTPKSPPVSPVLSSPSKSKMRAPGSGILSIASELARRKQQQQQMEREMSKTSPQVLQTPAPPSNPVVPSARLGSGKSSLEIKLVPSNAANKLSAPSKAELSKPQTSITLKSNVDKDKSKAAQPKVETVISKQPHSARTCPKAPQKRPNQPFKFHNYDDSNLKVAKDDGAKRAKLEERSTPAPTSPVKSNPKLYHSATISPFAPVHRPQTHPVSIPRP